MVSLTIDSMFVVFVFFGMVMTMQAEETTKIPELLTPMPLSEQVAAKEGWVQVAGARLWYWDTQGDGPAVVLVHPATGSGLIWGYQQPAFAQAGYRVIGYSRKYHAKSEVTAEDEIKSDVDDLHRLVQALELGKFHALGSAAGGGIVMRYAVKYPQSLRSMTIACSLGSVQDKKYRQACAALRTSSFYNLPPEFRELGPCYRAANPRGVRRWVELERSSRSGRARRPSPADSTVVTWDALAATKIPTLLVGGDADLYLPPPLLSYCHDRLPKSEMVVVNGAGHSAYWEQPAIFNRAVLKFLGKQKH